MSTVAKTENSFTRGAAYWVALLLSTSLWISSEGSSSFWKLTSIILIVVIIFRAISKEEAIPQKKMSVSEQLAYLDRYTRGSSASKPTSNSRQDHGIRPQSPQKSARHTMLLKMSKPDFWDTNNGLLFEKKCEEYYELLGYNVTRTKQSGDDGLDLIAVKNGLVLHIQCKAWARKIGTSTGNDVVRSTAGASLLYQKRQRYNGDTRIRVVIISTNGFTTNAKKAARELDVELIDTSFMIGVVRREIQLEISKSEHLHKQAAEKKHNESHIVSPVKPKEIVPATIPTFKSPTAVTKKCQNLKMSANYLAREALSKISRDLPSSFEEQAVIAVKRFCIANKINHIEFNSLATLLSSDLPDFIKSEVIVAKTEFYLTV